MDTKNLNVIGQSFSVNGTMRLLKKMETGQSFLYPRQLREGDWVLSSSRTVTVQVEQIGNDFYLVTRTA